MIVPIAAWHEEHVYFAQLLDLLEKELNAFRGDGTPNCELMLDVVSYLRDYGDAFHHPREDEAFRRLERRCPELTLEIVRLSREHRVIARAGEGLCAHLAAVVTGAMVPRADVEATAATYLAYYRGHLAAEEEQILTRAALELTAEDWEAVRLAAPPPGGAPLKSPGYYRELRRRIALEAI
jgi:hemerythrin-like domain-containing protein